MENPQPTESGNAERGWRRLWRQPALRVGALALDLTIAGGTAKPLNQQVQAKRGQPIIIRVNSDTEDQLHVHSNPEHTFNVKPEKDQQFQFTVDVPGKVDVELHHLDKTVATITVQ